MLSAKSSKDVQQVSRALLAALRGAADPALAPEMQAYMKSEQEFLGVKAPVRRKLQGPILRRLSVTSESDWEFAVLGLWSGARYREQRYAAVDFATAARFRRLLSASALGVFERLIVEGAWWDLVDAVSTGVGALLADHKASLRPKILRWARDKNLWKRRTAIICQRKLKGDTDLELLYACIEPNLEDREFFIQKAIGWALRSHAWSDAPEVRRYVAENRDRLKPLSLREASKHLGLTPNKTKTKPRKRATK